MIAVAVCLFGCAAIPPAPEPAALGPEPRPPAIREEDLGGEPRAGSARSEEGALPSPSSPLGGRGATAPPHVAAATRLAERGSARLADGNLGSAMEDLERAIAVDPTNAYAYTVLAEVHLARGSYDQAVAFAGRAADLSAGGEPRWLSRSYEVLGKAFEAAGHFTDARAAYRRALDLDGENLAARVGLTRVSGGGP